MQKFVFYRKYRPNSFKEIQGQEFIIKTLKNSIVLNCLSHTYIFSGPRGIGKTSIAKIFSKAINCLNSKDGDCCNECNNCNLINKNETTDFIEMDAASNNGVNEVRSIIDNISYLPTWLNKKIYIIDEAHMLTSSAWNAFLKTLEDPPENLIFIFATTEIHKIPVTIISRCQKFNFEKINSYDLTKHIEYICKLEKISIDKNSIEKIVNLSDGSLRDALSMLDQLSTFSNKNITNESINKAFGLIDIEKKLELLKYIVDSDVDKVFHIINSFEDQGINFYQLCIDIIEIILDKIIYEKTKNIKLLKKVSLLQINFIVVQPKILFDLISIWENAMIQIKNHLNSRFFFELACLTSTKLFNFEITNTSKNKNEDIKSESLIINKTTSMSFNKTENKSSLENYYDKFDLNKNSSISKKNDDNIQIINNNEEISKIMIEPIENIYQDDKSKKEETYQDEETKKYLDDVISKSFICKTINLKELDCKNLKNISKDSFAKIKEENIFIDKLIENNSKTKIIDNNFKNIENDKNNVINKSIENKTDQNKKPENIIDKKSVNLDIKNDSDEEHNLFSMDLQETSTKKNNENPLIKAKEIFSTQDKKIIGNENNKAENKIIDYSENCEIFNKIAFNKIDSEKERINKIFEKIKHNVPISPEEGYFVDATKILLASNNGFVILFDDEISAKNLNMESDEKNFIKYIKEKFNRPFKALAVTKKDVIDFTNVYKKNILEKIKLEDVNIDFMFKMFKNNNKSAQDIALEMLGDLIKED